jgi:NTP pyrophosphatase (non-canonical NTP hydrolase)
MSGSQTLNELARLCETNARAHGFHTPSSLTDIDGTLAKLMLVVTEVAEAAEAVRRGDAEHFPEELADILIRVFDLAGAMQLDLDAAVQAKMAKNVAREYRHGKLA